MFEGDGMHELKRKVGMIQSLDLSRGRRTLGILLHLRNGPLREKKRKFLN
jgi:hypothetical protein